MRRELLEQIRDYFANIQDIDDNEQHFLDEMNKELSDFEIAFLDKNAIERHGYDASDLCDSDMEELAGLMGDYYCGSEKFSIDLIDACEEFGLTPKNAE